MTSKEAFVSVFAKVAKIENAVEAACGVDFSVIRDADGNLFAWGSPQYGFLS